MPGHKISVHKIKRLNRKSVLSSLLVSGYNSIKESYLHSYY